MRRDRRARALLPAVCAVLLAAACRQDMHDQPRLEPLEPSPRAAGSGPFRPPPPGTVPRGGLETDRLLVTGKAEPAATALELFPTSEEDLEKTLAGLRGEVFSDVFPFPAGRPVLDRGRALFDINCAPCHGRLGYGVGIVVRRGFRQPPSYHEDRLRAAPAGHLFDVISRGLGAMGDFAGRIAARDRWAIAAHVRVLQFSQAAPRAAVPGDLQPLLPQHGPLTFTRGGYVPAADELARLEAEEAERLRSYGWMDAGARIAHIPLDRAAEILAARGLPARREERR